MSSAAVASTNSSTKFGCFNCARYQCSVAKCPFPKDPARIAQRLYKWRELLKLERNTRLNLALVNLVCSGPQESQDVLTTTIYPDEVIAQEDEATDESPQEDGLGNVHEGLHSSEVQHIIEECESEDQLSDLFKDKTETYGVKFVGMAHSLHQDRFSHGVHPLDDVEVVDLTGDGDAN